MISRRILIILFAALAHVSMLSATAMASGDTAAGGPSIFTGDIGNVIWSLVTFVMVLVVLGKFAWGPILGGLKKREEFIRDSLEQARKDREDAEKALKDYTAQIEAARDQASEIVAEGRRDSEALKLKIESSARAEAEALIERATREIGIAKESAVKELYDTSASLATQIAGRIIGKEVDATVHDRLIRESIEELTRISSN